ncbi:MAG TPA: CpXC domain-containing protein [Candidatus Cloacimonadota bacterium]|nr:CpXC domain-containing protein [Candidatus Cloacimonadota bacterium]
MSQKNRVKLTCSNCGNVFEATLYRTIWGEHQENRDLVMNDLINVVECPSCHEKAKVEYALFYNDTNVLCGVWWEPHPEPEIDECAAGWSQMWGVDNYMAQAPRIKDWQEFKETIGKFYSGELKGTPPVQLRQKQKHLKKLIKLPKLQKHHILAILGALVLLGSLSIATVSLIQIKELKEQIADLEQEIDNPNNDYSSEISGLESKIDDCESQIYDLEDEVNDLQRYSHYHY